MSDLPISLGTLSTIVSIVGAAVGLALAQRRATEELRDKLSAEIAAQQRESSEGRKALYARIEDSIDRLRSEMRDGYLRQDVYAADRRTDEAKWRTLDHALTETNQITTALAQRTCPCDENPRFAKRSIGAE